MSGLSVKPRQRFCMPLIQYSDKIWSGKVMNASLIWRVGECLFAHLSSNTSPSHRMKHYVLPTILNMPCKWILHLQCKSLVFVYIEIANILPVLLENTSGYNPTRCTILSLSKFVIKIRHSFVGKLINYKFFAVSYVSCCRWANIKQIGSTLGLYSATFPTQQWVCIKLQLVHIGCRPKRMKWQRFQAELCYITIHIFIQTKNKCIKSNFEGIIQHVIYVPIWTEFAETRFTVILLSRISGL